MEKNNSIVNTLNKTKEERFPDLQKEQRDREKEIALVNKERRRVEAKARKLAEVEEAKRKEELSYDRIHSEDQISSTLDFEATADSAAAEEYEDDFF